MSLVRSKIVYLKKTSKNNSNSYMFFLFKISALYLNSESYAQRCALLIINVLIAVYHFLRQTSVYIQADTFSPKNRASAVYIITCLLHRFLLCLIIPRFLDISRGMSQLITVYQVKLHKRKCTPVWITLAFLAYGYVFSMNVFTLHRKYNLELTLFGFKPSSGALRLALAIFVACEQFLFLMLPVLSFAIYYEATCHRLQDLIRKMKHSLENSINPDYELLLKRYLSIQDLFHKIDSSMSILMFTLSLYNASGIFFGITCLLHPGDYFDRFARSTTWALSAATLLQFLGVTLSAVKMHEESTDLCRTSQILSIEKEKMSNSQKKFLSIVEKNLVLTVWKIVPIKRSFVPAFLGTIFTYCILLGDMNI